MIDRNDYNRRLIEEFRANRSKFEGPGSRPLLLLTTIGAKSGQRHTTPMMYITRNCSVRSNSADAGGARPENCVIYQETNLGSFCIG